MEPARNLSRRWLTGCVTLFLAAALALTGCDAPAFLAAPATVTPSPSPSATLTPTPTETIAWFPPTFTPTNLPTQNLEPTPDLRPVLLGEIFTDPFLNTSFWPTYRNTTGSVGYGNGELTLAMPTANGVLSTLRKDTILTDFYMEVTVEPSLCRGPDSFGVLFRATSEWNTYRFVVSCDGQMRAERVREGQLLPLTEWQPSEQLIFGTGPELRLGVMAYGSEFRFFINDVFQFSLRDPVFPDGQIGLFARSENDSALTVNFTRMVVSRVDASSLVFTATPTPPVRPSATRQPTATITPTR
jgi:hypothetical protein